MNIISKVILILMAISLTGTCLFVIVGSFFLDGFEMLDMSVHIFGVNIGLGMLFLMSVVIPMGYEMVFEKDTDKLTSPKKG